jgi:membrane-bound inhibitor of C-type lysozyme
MRFSRKLTVTAGIAASTLAAGVAFAAWTATGAGSGSATSTQHSNSVIASASTGENLYPGATKSFTVTISNPNDYPSIVTSISAGRSDAVSTCDADTVTSDAVSSASGITRSDAASAIIPAGGTGTYTLASHMKADPQQACENQTFTLPLTAVLQSNAS